MRNCVEEKEIDFCYECSDFPCKLLQEIGGTP
ncbi:TPA: DUF3795 domain-containing protein [Candidatus Bathyarchaeota archaeon]|nr:DUF3795 domain-containing protein [Candidatus Bathyarchaeota archaeon]